MESGTIGEIVEQLRRLPPDKLALVAQFIASLTEDSPDDGDLRYLLLAAEASLRKDWDTPEDDDVWRDL
jgi:hypothetical protein